MQRKKQAQLCNKCGMYSNKLLNLTLQRDLTADEISLVAREAPLPVQNNSQAHFAESMS